ncbi:MAG: hypothetical protein ACLFVS_04800 [Candidatus Acetothermia bacterium]
MKPISIVDYVKDVFKSEQEKEIERKVQYKQQLNSMDRQIRNLEKQEEELINEARKALSEDLKESYQTLKSELKNIVRKIRMFKTCRTQFKVLLIEKDSMKAYQKFGTAVEDLSSIMAKYFDPSNIGKAMVSFEESMVKAEQQEEQIKAFIDSSTDAISGLANVDGEDVDVTDDYIDDLIKGEAAHEEEGNFDKEIEDALSEIDSLKDKE